MNFNFIIKKNLPYMEMIITSNNLVLSSGLLDTRESIDLAKDLICAAEQLLPMKMDEIKQSLCDIEGKL
ncbi:MAG: hypothetical protein SWO11_23010 [Thermodesulfobacteriota bacterium]|nr:hypothetical protein [Thermodesulfobacteriota bacterium]